MVSEKADRFADISAKCPDGRSDSDLKSAEMTPWHPAQIKEMKRTSTPAADKIDPATKSVPDDLSNSRPGK
jgi:hypothetical protein